MNAQEKKAFYALVALHMPVQVNALNLSTLLSIKGDDKTGLGRYDAEDINQIINLAEEAWANHT